MSLDPATITRETAATGGRYVYRLNGAEAEMTYVETGAGVWVIDHTLVPDVFRGQGVGAALVARGVADARAAGVRILPLCSFAAAQFRRHPEWSDILETQS